MTSPEDYLYRLGEIAGDDLSDGSCDIKIELKDKVEARQFIDELRHRRQRIEALKREISDTISEIKSSHANEHAFVGTGLGAIVAGLTLGHKWTGRMNTIQRELIRQSKVSKVAPYEALKQFADKICSDFEQARDQIQNSSIMGVEPSGAGNDSRSLPEAFQDPRGAFIYLGDEVKGPFNFEQLRALHEVGTISDDSLCCYEGTEEWQPYSNIK